MIKAIMNGNIIKKINVINTTLLMLILVILGLTVSIHTNQIFPQIRSVVGDALNAVRVEARERWGIYGILIKIRNIL